MRQPLGRMKFLRKKNMKSQQLEDFFSCNFSADIFDTGPSVRKPIPKEVSFILNLTYKQYMTWRDDHRDDFTVFWDKRNKNLYRLNFEQCKQVPGFRCLWKGEFERLHKILEKLLVRPEREE